MARRLAVGGLNASRPRAGNKGRPARPPRAQDLNLASLAFAATHTTCQDF
jgi:hypothetical protein